MEASADLERIRKFIIEHIPKARQLEIQDDEQLLENGLLDSLGILDVVTYLEEEFGISVSDEELTPDNFQSIQTMSGYVQEKKSQISSSN
ncbi:MAG: acyl carrier protein [Nitrospirales bacterium]